MEIYGKVNGKKEFHIQEKEYLYGRIVLSFLVILYRDYTKVQGYTPIQIVVHGKVNGRTANVLQVME